MEGDTMDEKDLLEIRLSDGTAEEISLSEIDPKAIKLIREIKQKNNTNYRQLRIAIERDGQQQPIIIRELNDEENSRLSNSKAREIKYGIIDGHHRYMIARELKKDSISAIVDKGENSEVRDIILAMRFNESSIKMTSIQKGKVIYDLLKSLNGESNEKIIADIGMKLFGLKSSMTYRCLHNYKKTIDEKTVEKPRDNRFRRSEVADICDLLPEDISTLADISAEDGLKQLENIKKIEQQLGDLKKTISSLEQVKFAMKAKRQENVKLARAKKNAAVDK